MSSQTHPAPYVRSAALIQRRRERDAEISTRRLYVTRHQDGLCGYMGQSCSACISDEVVELVAWAKVNAPAPVQGEDFHTYWRRVPNAPWPDAWVDAAKQLVREVAL